MTNTHRRLFPFFIAPLFAALLTQHADAARPLVSETADSLEKGSCDIDSAVRRARESGSPNVNGIGSVLGCGLGDSTQMILGWQRASGGGTSAQALSLGGKTNLVPVEDGRTGFGVVYLLGAVKAGSGGFEYDITSIVGLASRELAKGVFGHANLGLVRSRLDDKTRAVWSLGLESTAELGFTADVFGESGSRPSLSVGVNYIFAPGWSINAALAKALEAPRGHEVSLGLRVAF